MIASYTGAGAGQMAAKARKAEPGRDRLEELIQVLNVAAQAAKEEPALACAAALTLAARYAVLLGVDEQTFLRHAQAIASEAQEQQHELSQLLPPLDALH
jgi:hypothetical protein